MHSKSPAVAALKAAFPHTIPIFAGFLFLGMTYGVYMRTSGFSFWYPMIMSVVIFGGSLEFVATSMLLAPFAPVQVFLTAVMIQARHLFYGISMLDKYRGTGWKKPYLIYAMCDETFSVNYTAEIPEGVDRGWFYFFVSLLDEFYWFLGATLGGILGGLLRFNTEGRRCLWSSSWTSGSRKSTISARGSVLSQVLRVCSFLVRTTSSFPR